MPPPESPESDRQRRIAQRERDDRRQIARGGPGGPRKCPECRSRGHRADCPLCGGRGEVGTETTVRYRVIPGSAAEVANIHDENGLVASVFEDRPGTAQFLADCLAARDGDLKALDRVLEILGTARRTRLVEEDTGEHPALPDVAYEIGGET